MTAYGSKQFEARIGSWIVASLDWKSEKETDKEQAD